MKAVLVGMLVASLSLPLMAQQPALCGVNVVCTQIAPSDPLLLAIQNLSAQIAALQPLLVARQTVPMSTSPVQPVPAKPSAGAQFLNNIGALLSNPAVLSAIGTVATCRISKKC